jgi:phosphoglycerol transferase MdoB-like AlkP superfamily enzyme
LTPNLDRFASQSLLMSSFYNAVTPTINSLVSSQCGILSKVENNSLDTDRGYTRNLSCLSDVLHDAGYHQEFLGGADSGFSGKRLFLNAHHFDEVWGWERWGKKGEYEDEGRRNAWGLNDTDLMREAIARFSDDSDFLDFKADYGMATVCGHTAVQQPAGPEPSSPCRR